MEVTVKDCEVVAVMDPREAEAIGIVLTNSECSVGGGDQPNIEVTELGGQLLDAATAARRQTDATKLAQALQGRPLDIRIARFFLDHTDAVDTWEGIADWWVQEDRRLTREALDRLMQVGIVVRRVRGGRELFSLTQDLNVRSYLNHVLKGQPKLTA